MATDLSQFTVPNNRFDVAQDNAAKLDSAVNGPDAVVTTRTGKGIQSIDRIIASIAAVTDRGAWTTATSYQVKDLVTDSGIFYIAITAHTSGATFAGDVAAKWRVYQGITQDQFTTRGDLRFGTTFSTISAMTSVSPVSIDGVVVIPVIGMPMDVLDYAAGNNSGRLTGEVVAAATGTADGGAFIDLAGGLQWKQDFIAGISDVKQYGAKGDGIENDGPELLVALDKDGIELSSGDYANTNTAITQDFADTAILKPGADVTDSGSGTTTFDGVAIREGYNPSNQVAWATPVAFNYEGLSVELGGYGPRQFGSLGTPSAINGSINIPASSAVANHASGVTGYAKTASPTTGAVAIYGEVVAEAASTAIFGFNSRSLDNGFACSVWGSEVDINISNAASTVRGIDLTGGSAVKPAISEGFRLGPINAFTNIAWDRAFVSADNGADTALSIGAQQVTNSGMQSIEGFFRDGSDVRTQLLSITGDSSGNLTLGNEVGTALFVLKSGANQPVKILGNQLGFFGGSPAGKPTVTGAKGGNAALTSLISALVALGLITDTTT
jgi:hypothetical protein